VYPPFVESRVHTFPRRASDPVDLVFDSVDSPAFRFRRKSSISRSPRATWQPTAMDRVVNPVAADARFPLLSGTRLKIVQAIQDGARMAR